VIYLRLGTSPGPWQVLMSILVYLWEYSWVMRPTGLDHPETWIPEDLGLYFVVTGTCGGYLLFTCCES